MNARAKRENWESRPRQALGGGNEYAFAALPVQTQTAILQSTAAISAPVAGPRNPVKRSREAAAVEALGALYDSKSDSQKEEAQRRLGAVQTYHGLLDLGQKPGVAQSATCMQYGIGLTTFGRWLKMVDGIARDKWLFALVPAYCGRVAVADCDDEAWTVLKADYLRPEEPTAKACIRRLRNIAAKNGWTLPADRTLERRLAKLPRTIKVLARKGLDAVAELYPAQQRDKTALAALDIVVADGYTHNVFVTMPEGGDPVRVKGWYWQDVYSGKILAWRLDRTEHTDVIRLSFGDLVEQFGIPRAVNIDNTLAAANKTMTGGTKTRFRFKIREDEPLGVFPLLDVRTMWATPGHGQAKPIERAFGKGGLGEVIDRHPELAGAYTGTGPLNKPDNYGKRAVPLQLLVDVVAREIAIWNARDGRRGAIAQGRSFDAVFTESYETTVIRTATETQRRLWLLATEPVTAHAKDGSIGLDAGRSTGERQKGTNRYWNAAMTEFAGHKLVARFDPQRLHQGVHVYHLDGRYICFADCHAPQGYNDNNAAREHARERKSFVRNQRDALASLNRMDALEAARYLTAADAPLSPAVNPANAKVVAVKFGDPLQRDLPKPVIAPEVAALRAELEAPRAEIDKGTVIDGGDFVARYRLANRLQRKLAAGEYVHARDVAWMTEYMDSPEYRDTKDMHEAQPASA